MNERMNVATKGGTKRREAMILSSRCTKKDDLVFINCEDEGGRGECLTDF